MRKEIWRTHFICGFQSQGSSVMRLIFTAGSGYDSHGTGKCGRSIDFSGYDARNGSIWYDSVVDIREMAGSNQTWQPCGGGGSSGPAGKSNDPDWKQCGRSFGSRSLCTLLEWGSFEEMFLPWTVSQYSGI